MFTGSYVAIIRTRCKRSVSTSSLLSPRSKSRRCVPQITGLSEHERPSAKGTENVSSHGIRSHWASRPKAVRLRAAMSDSGASAHRDILISLACARIVRAEPERHKNTRRQHDNMCNLMFANFVITSNCAITDTTLDLLGNPASRPDAQPSDQRPINQRAHLVLG